MLIRRLSTPLLFLAALVLAAPAGAQLLDILKSPKTLVDRVIEARSTADIVADNKIVVKVNALMAEFRTIQASTEIYEQRLLITGLFDDKKLYKKFEDGVKKIKGVKKLYWHVKYMSKKDQEKNKARLMSWGDAMLLDATIGVKLIGTRGVADVNYQVAVDAFGTAYLIGRARSQPELQKALQTVRGTKDVRRVVNLVEVRP